MRMTSASLISGIRGKGFDLLSSTEVKRLWRNLRIQATIPFNWISEIDPTNFERFISGSLFGCSNIPA
jgi:hypothetical protein